MAITPFNVDSDFDLIDNLADVTLDFKRSGGTTTVSGVSALVRGFNKPVAFFQGISIRGDELVYNLKADDLGVNIPESGDTITTAGAVVYTILSAQLFSFDSRWRCLCRAER